MNHSLLRVLGIVLAFGVAPARAAVPSFTIELEEFVAVPGAPVAITHAGDGSGRLFITLQDGRIVIHDGTQLLPTPFLDISALVQCCGERGLLSVAFHPQYATNGRFYLNYSTPVATVIARYEVSGDPDVADPGSATIVLTIPQPFSNHNGGQLQFGPDGYLYIGMGDGGSGGDPDNRAQDLGDLLGKMLRIDVDGASPYGIPPSNPFVGVAGALDEIWAYGFRNPWRFSFDRLTGDLFIADVGQNGWEEVDFQPASSTGGENYGWRLMEGNQCFNPPTACNPGSLVLPILEYGHAFGCSISGGYRYRGSRYPQMTGTYFYADFCSGRIWGGTEDGGGWTATEFLVTALPLSTFGEDEDGEVYVAELLGRIFRVVPAPACSDGLDNDGDGRIDFDLVTFSSPGDQNTPPSGLGDPGCLGADWLTEEPECQDGDHNDADGKMDYDAGFLANGVADPAGPDPQCVGKPWQLAEQPAPRRCGLGLELALLLPAILLRWQRRPMPRSPEQRLAGEGR